MKRRPTKKQLARMPKRNTRRKKNHEILAHILIGVGLFLIFIWGIHTTLYRRSIQLSESLLAAYASQNPADNLSYPSFISIGETIQLPVVPAGYVNGKWLISETGANHITKSATPGTRGNIIIYAHNRWNLFGPLSQITKGDIIRIHTSDGKTFRYKVTNVLTVTPQDTSLLAPTAREVLTIYTCTGFLDSQRLVVRANPL